jgi:hypothetical protein
MNRILALLLATLLVVGPARAQLVLPGGGSGSGGGGVSSITTSCGVSGGPISSTGNLSSIATSNIQSGSNYAFQSTDCGTIVYLSNGSNQVPTIAQAGTGSFTAGWYVEVCNIGAGTQTITPTTSTIGGASTYVLAAGSAAAPKCVGVNSDGTNYVLDLTGPLATGTSGHTIPYLDGSNTWSGTQTFGAVVGTVTTQSGTIYTLTSSDCGTTVRFSNGSAVTVTIPQGLAVGCVIAIEQAGAGQVSVNGSAVTPATLHSAHAYTKTSGQWAVIGIFTESSNVAVLTGDGA